MQKRFFLFTVAVCLLAVAAPAIDRGASMVDTISVEGIQHDGGDSLGGSLWGETVTATKEQQWAILLGGGLGTLWPDLGDGIDYWELGIGVKYYLLRETSLALITSYRELDMTDDPDIFTTEFTLKQRIIPAEEAISPFVRAGLGTRTVEYIPEPDIDDAFTEMILSFGVGVDFMMADNFAIVFESVWYLTEELDEDETPDWWFGRIGMQYYWE
jgi:hypothetical protein